MTEYAPESLIIAHQYSPDGLWRQGYTVERWPRAIVVDVRVLTLATAGQTPDCWMDGELLVFGAMNGQAAYRILDDPSLPGGAFPAQLVWATGPAPDGWEETP